MPFTPLATNRVSLLPDFRGTMTVPTTLTTVLSTISAPAAAATSRAAIGTVISYPWSTFCTVVLRSAGECTRPRWRARPGCSPGAEAAFLAATAARFASRDSTTYCRRSASIWQRHTHGGPVTFEEFASVRLPAVLKFAAVLAGDRGLAEDVVPRRWPGWLAPAAAAAAVAGVIIGSLAISGLVLRPAATGPVGSSGVFAKVPK